MDPTGYNTGYVEEIYELYKNDPNSVSQAWRDFFEGYNPSSGNAQSPTPDLAQPQHPEVQATPKETPAPVATPSSKAPLAIPTPEGAEVQLIKGAASRIVSNMDASLDMPTATSVRTIPVKLMAENRRLINDYQRTRGGSKVSFTHIIAWAMVKALQQFPNMYAGYKEENGKPYKIVPKHLNLGIAVSIENKGQSSLVVPNVKGANQMNFAQFLSGFNGLIKKSRSNTLEIADFEGTTASLTNPGMIGTVMSVPRLMPGQGVIVATGAIGFPPEYSAMPEKELHRMGISQVMTLTSTYDHRIIQGAESGAFLNAMAELLTGNHNFYYELFTDLNIPQPPLSQSLDLTPFGRSRYGEEDTAKKQAQVLQLIRAYRTNGHLVADTNPLGYEGKYTSQLDPAEYGLTIWDLDREFYTNNLAGYEKLTLREILDILYETYTRKVGIEYMHIDRRAELIWLQERIEPTRMQDALPKEIQHRTLEKLNAAEALEKFIHTKYIGHKRFSLEGAESMIPILDRIISDAADQEVKEIVVGMAHRGRLNVLANILGKPYEKLFSEFEGYIDPTSTQGSGDVKYHLGTSSKVKSANDAEIKVHLSANPSHLEAVDPVVEGMARALQDNLWDEKQDLVVNYDNVIPILIHGDAAFAGQGVVAETMNLSQLKGYRTGGTIHLVVNNQIGFTTNPEDARSSHYATDIARMIQAPTFHVNGDDPEACIRVAKLALDYRQVFNKDVVIDMVCYRLHGHNEGDDPSYTQPLLYQKINNHRSTRKIYTELLLRRGDLNPEGAEQILNDFQARLTEAFERTKDLVSKKSPEKAVEAPLKNQPAYDTAVSAGILETVVKGLTNIPADFPAHPKLVRQLQDRFKQYFEQQKIDWALGEALAFGTLLLEGHRVRLSGEDVGRGTFSHRHSVLHSTQKQGEKYIPLNNLAEGQAKYEVYDSLLSEYAVLGFEYGYSVFNSETLVIWEAQFGDFANGAQIIFDQFISAAEAKWGQTCSLVCLLPHSYEGQGPEHSSARLERYLQLCAEDNMFVCNFTTPANLFHALRRQMKLDVPKPLIIMSPKSLLRHKAVVSSPQDFSEGQFMPIIPSALHQAKKLVLCSGKVYYDAVDALEKAGKSEEIALLRVEQYYPFPAEAVAAEIAKFGVSEVSWLQEEPENMGAWRFVAPYLTKLGVAVRYIGREASASTATGIAKVHALQQEAILAVMME